jgi:dimethylglycine dehydrogenase
MMVEGEAEIDMASLDPKRYGELDDDRIRRAQERGMLPTSIILHHPDEEREACRRCAPAPAYDRQKARGAQFGQVNGWERPNYYGPLDAPEGFDHDARSFPPRGGWWQYAGRGRGDPHRRRPDRRDGLHQAPGSRGPGATAFLDWFTCNKLPKVGRINLTYALTDAGTTRTEYTIVRWPRTSTTSSRRGVDGL